MGKEKRRFPRIVMNAFIRFYEELPYSMEQDYYQGMVKNYSEGGLLITTEHPLAEGCVTVVEIPVETAVGEVRVVQIRGIVRRVRPSPDRKIMGVEFFEFKESGLRDFHEWMERLLE